MFGKFYSKLAQFALKRADLSIQDSATLSRIVLDKLRGLPLKDMIQADGFGNVLINGKPVDQELLANLRESARGALVNQAFLLIQEQVAFNAIKVGIHTAQDYAQLFFARSAIWWGQQQMELLRILAGQSEE